MLARGSNPQGYHVRYRVINRKARPQPQRFLAAAPGEKPSYDHEARRKDEAGVSGVHPPADIVINQNQQLMDDLSANATPAPLFARE